jgi:NADH-quinone oxidoreductase subunit A
MIHETMVVLPIFGLLILTALGCLVGIEYLLGRYKPQWDKEQPYECGIPPTGDARLHMPVHYYVVAVSFVIFDIETAFLFTWAAAYWDLGPAATLGACLFIIIMLLGLVYEWRKGGLSWSPEKTPRDL